MALGALGSCAFEPLAKSLFDPTQHERQLVALELLEMCHDPSVGTNKVLPYVIKAMKDSDPALSRYASMFYAQIAFEPRQRSVPKPLISEQQAFRDTLNKTPCLIALCTKILDVHWCIGSHSKCSICLRLRRWR